jgi:hypothetical protein
MRAQLCSVFVAAAGHLATASTASVSTDFQLTARFFPGAGWAEGGPEPWHLTISSDGKALQETYSYGGDRELKHIKATQLSQSALTDIVTAFRRIDFFTLPKKMIVDTSGEPGHQMGITLKVTSDGHSHTVTFSVPGTIRDRPAALRFWQAWSVVAQKVRSPNKNTEFNYWLHYNPL